MLVPRGDTEAFAWRIAELLKASVERYEALVEASLVTADRHRLSVLVPPTPRDLPGGSRCPSPSADPFTD